MDGSTEREADIPTGNDWLQFGVHVYVYICMFVPDSHIIISTSIFMYHLPFDRDWITFLLLGVWEEMRADSD